MGSSLDRDGWLRLSLAAGVGPRTAGALVRALGGPARAARAPPSVLARVHGLSLDRAARLARALEEAEPARVLRDAQALGQTVLTPADDGYPQALRDSPDAPPAVYVLGALPGAERPWVAIVGTRAASPYGRRVARALAAELARDGAVVVSGLARGVDAEAHAGAVAAGGRTVGVLGCGADVVYPPEHGGLAADVVAHGALVSEHPPGTPPHPGHFPRRNRIVAALSRAVVVVEAPLASGALGTARLAAEAGRDVLAVPGPVDRGTHAGCHRLLRDGALLCESPADVRRALGLEVAPGRAGPPRPAGPVDDPLPPPATGPARVVWGLLDLDDAIDAEEIARRSGLSPDEVAAGLSELELLGRAAWTPGVGARRLA